MRRVSGEKRRRRGRSAVTGRTTASRPASAGRSPAVSTVAVAVSDAIQRLDLGELAVDHLELLAQPLDVAVDRPVVDIDVLAIGRVHQLVATLDVTLAGRQRFED